MAANPYVPGSGIMPPSLAGREAELALFDSLPQRTRNGLLSRGIILTGLRGVGKTVLLEAFRLRADEAGWVTCSIEASPEAAARVNSSAWGRECFNLSPGFRRVFQFISAPQHHRRSGPWAWLGMR
ncbi:MAG: ATP-binding protein [Bifidobacteriaceae bacterium]|jgi:hypothetical protein|nr:ATP-binding protein [Bifidobacteriaceae bacterium]